MLTHCISIFKSGMSRDRMALQSTNGSYFKFLVTSLTSLLIIYDLCSTNNLHKSSSYILLFRLQWELGQGDFLDVLCCNGVTCGPMCYRGYTSTADWQTLLMQKAHLMRPYGNLKLHQRGTMYCHLTLFPASGIFESKGFWRIYLSHYQCSHRS